MKLNSFFCICVLFVLIFLVSSASFAVSSIKIETIKYQNGDIYQGEVKDGKPHGVGEWSGSLYSPDGAPKYTCDKFVEYAAQNFTSIQEINNFIKLQTNFFDIVWNKRPWGQLTSSEQVGILFPEFCFVEYNINLNYISEIKRENFFLIDWKPSFSKSFKGIERKKFSQNQLDTYKEKEIYYIKYKGEFKNGKVHGQGLLNCKDQRSYDLNKNARIDIPIIVSDIFLGGFYTCAQDFFGDWENGAKKIGYFKRFIHKEIPSEYRSPNSQREEKRHSFLRSYLSLKDIQKGFVSPVDCFVLSKFIWKNPSSARFANTIRMLELDRFIYYGFVNENGKPDCAGAVIDSKGLITIQQFRDGNVVDGVGFFLYPVKKMLIEIPILASAFKKDDSYKYKKDYLMTITKQLFYTLILHDKPQSLERRIKVYGRASGIWGVSAQTIYDNHDIIYSNYKIENGNTLVNDQEGQKLCFSKDAGAIWIKTKIVDSNGYCK